MCGLCGIAYERQIDKLSVRLEEMSARIAHRGPDGQGSFQAAGIALAHRRLSVLDLTPSGAQPMRSVSGDVVVVFNGEIFNFRELRIELSSRGHNFFGKSDTEVILAAYNEWGYKGLEKLEGMFAIALWDAKDRCLLLMRDRLGIKPLFYSMIPGAIVFGSEIKAILASGLVHRRVDQQAMSEYLWFGNSHEDRTIYSTVRSLEPGCRLLWRAPRCHVEKWWTIEQWLNAADANRIRSDPVSAVRESIDAAVRRQLVADVPVGIFLSGGIDSSAIAVSAAATTERQKIQCFAAGFGALGSVDERDKARRVAEVLNMRHESVDISSFDIETVVRKMIESHDEPFADAANIPLFVLSRRISGKVKVVLQGDGGDELFGGYRRYLLLLHLRAWQHVPAWLFHQRFIRGHPLLMRLDRIGKTLSLEDPAMRMALLLTTDTPVNSSVRYFGAEMMRRLMKESDPFLAYRNAAARFGKHDPVTMMLLTDMTVQLPSQFLPKVDRATMANGVEARVPLLDEIVCKTALNLPLSMKVKGLQKKIALRAAIRTCVPDDIVDGRKTGFSVPYERWLAGPLSEMAEELLLSKPFVERFNVDAARVRLGLQELRRGNLGIGYQLWKLTQLALWAENQDDDFI